MIYLEKPKDFNPKLEAVGCFVQCNGEIALLLRQDHKPQGNTWGIPSGKVHEGENLAQTAIRETKEETGFNFSEEEMKFFKTVWVRFPEYDFVYHIFYADLDEKKEIRINSKEHKDAKWASPFDVLKLPLIGDLDGCINLFFGI